MKNHSQSFKQFNQWSDYCPGKEAALGSIVSAAADPLYHIPKWNFDYVTGKSHIT